MRDPKRIPQILQKLEVIWKKYPDMRLGQLVENAKLQSPSPNIDTFYLEDDDLKVGLDFLLHQNEDKS